ncbi:MAG: methylated-DNA--[protein]-cysteine S-methyltransferase [Proteobacteria bacterium]|nr:MAG: methylated-DNA--[protein]-cysteine S-methyltransferase [Pseudomonadota bacterium]
MMTSPVGDLKLVASSIGVVAILWGADDVRVRFESLEQDAHLPLLLETEKQLSEYFAGSRTSFDLPLDFRGTEFQKSVWTELLKIPFGETRTYGQIAHSLNNPKSVRAVGAANGKNPISIVAPCHRVIGANGTLTGFAGGLPTKHHLLQLEKVPVDFPPLGASSV